MERKLTDHHQVPESYGGTRSRNNINRLPEDKHRAFHFIFDNRTFVGQILRLSELNATSLSRRMVSDVNDLLSGYRGDNEICAYKEGVLKETVFLDALYKFHHNPPGNPF